MKRNISNKSGKQLTGKKWSVAIAAILFIAAAAQADWLEKAKLIPAEGDSWFGRSVSINGDYAIVGADTIDFKGSAYIFKREDANWIQQAKLLASDAARGDMFGMSVAISGDLAIVGAQGDNSYRGSAYIFKRIDVNWVQQTKLLASDGAASDMFGSSVSISGDWAIVGAEGDDGSRGSAYLFKRDGTIWSQKAKITASDGVEGDMFSCPVSISDDYVIAGAMNADGSEIDSGAAYIFVRDGNNWNQQAKLIASDGAEGDMLGCSVSLKDQFAIAGAFYAEGSVPYSGAAYVFVRDGNSWTQQAKLAASDGAESDQFGAAVSIDGLHAFVGAIQDDDNGADSGSAYVFIRDGNSWSQQEKILASDGAAGDQFGYSVSIDAGFAIVGAECDDNLKGSAYVFNWYCPRADLNDDCDVDFTDLAIFADAWLFGKD